MPEQQDKFKELADLYKTVKNSLTREEFMLAFRQVADSLGSALAVMNKRIDERLSQVKNGKDGKDGRDGKDGKDGKSIKGDKGEKGDKGDTGTAIFGGKGKDGSPDTPEQIVIKLESLEGEDRLDASAIKNLPEFVQNNYPAVISGKGPLWALQDVDVSGITVGQSIKWDGVRWIPFTPAGANSSAYNEVAGGSGTAWTLAHTPVSGTLRVYANGQRLIETTDYSLSGTDLTTVLSWDAGTVLVDYEY